MTDVVAWWGAVTGTSSVLLLGARFIWDRGSDHRETQKELRRDVRTIVEGVLTECSEAKAAMSAGKKVGPKKPHVETGETRLEALGKRLTPTPLDPKLVVMIAAPAVRSIQHEWNSVELDEKYHDEGERLVKAHHRMRDGLETWMPYLQGVLDKLNEIDKRSV